jgi:GWxTD domain-containing protein
MAKTFRRVRSTTCLLLAGWQILFMPSLKLTGALALQTDSVKQLSDPFLKRWLLQDVVYLASDAEKASYLNLASDTERYEFIERFWQQRDPSPGTTANEFRDEHYRRINYANGRFSSAEPGWKTDRGRIYVTLGPPDQIESHPSGAGRIGPFEIWRYRAVPGSSERVLEFVVLEGRTDYILIQRQYLDGAKR